MRLVACFAALAALVMIGCAAAGGVAPAPEPLGNVGMKPPSMILPDTENVEHDIRRSSNGDGPVCIYFWSVFCSNCKDAMPLLFELNQRWKAKGLTIWAVNVDGDRFTNAVDAYLKDVELPFPVVFDRLEGQYLIAADPLNVSKTPTLLLLDKGGVIHLRQEVAIDLPAVEKTVEELLR